MGQVQQLRASVCDVDEPFKRKLVRVLHRASWRTCCQSTSGLGTSLKEMCPDPQLEPCHKTTGSCSVLEARLNLKWSLQRRLSSGGDFPGCRGEHCAVYRYLSSLLIAH